MQSLKITQDQVLPVDTKLYLQLYTPSLPSGSTGASGSFSDVDYTRLDDYSLVMNGDFDIVPNDFYEPTIMMRNYYEQYPGCVECAYGQSTYYAKGIAIEVSPNNFELQ